MSAVTSFVTGGAGFIDSALVRPLIAESNFEHVVSGDYRNWMEQSYKDRNAA